MHVYFLSVAQKKLHHISFENASSRILKFATVCMDLRKNNGSRLILTKRVTHYGSRCSVPGFALLILSICDACRLKTLPKDYLQDFFCNYTRFLDSRPSKPLPSTPSFSISSRSRMNSDRIGPTKAQRPTLMDSDLVSPRPDSRLVCLFNFSALVSLRI